MFESISFRTQNKTDANNPLDIGLLLECMLFYRTTNIIANQTILKQLIREFGLDQFVALLEERLLKIIYTESFTGIHTATINNGLQLYDPVIFSSPQHTFQEIIRRHCIELTGKEGKGRRIARRIETNITVVHHDTILTDGGRKSLLDQDYLRKAIPLVINHIFPHAGIDAGMEFGPGGPFPTPARIANGRTASGRIVGVASPNLSGKDQRHFYVESIPVDSMRVPPFPTASILGPRHREYWGNQIHRGFYPF